MRGRGGGRDGGARGGGAGTGGGEPGAPAAPLLGVEAGVQRGDGPGGGAGLLPAAAGGRGEVPVADGDEPAEPLGALVPPGAEAGADDRRPGRLGGDPDLAPGGGAAVPPARRGVGPRACLRGVTTAGTVGRSSRRYLFGRPLGVEGFATFLRSRRKPPRSGTGISWPFGFFSFFFCFLSPTT